MRTATIQNKVLVQFSKGIKQEYKTTKTIPQIRERFALGKKFYTNEEINDIVVVESVTIGKV